MINYFDKQLIERIEVDEIDFLEDKAKIKILDDCLEIKDLTIEILVYIDICIQNLDGDNLYIEKLKYYERQYNQIKKAIKIKNTSISSGTIWRN